MCCAQSDEPAPELIPVCLSSPAAFLFLPSISGFFFLFYLVMCFGDLPWGISLGVCVISGCGKLCPSKHLMAERLTETWVTIKHLSITLPLLSVLPPPMSTHPTLSPTKPVLVIGYGDGAFGCSATQTRWGSCIKKGVGTWMTAPMSCCRGWSRSGPR